MGWLYLWRNRRTGELAVTAYPAAEETCGAACPWVFVARREAP